MAEQLDDGARAIRRALEQSDQPALTLAQLQEQTCLPSASLNVDLEKLCDTGEVIKTEDGHGTLWLSLPADFR